MAGKFEVYKDRSGKFRFRLKASNGQVVATGEAYETKAAAKRAANRSCERRPALRSRKPIRRVLARQHRLRRRPGGHQSRQVPRSAGSR